MDKLSHVQWSIVWNYVSLPKLQWSHHHWSLRMEKYFHTTLYYGFNCSPMLGLKLNHVSKRGPEGWINIKMPSYQYRKSHCGDKTILRPSYLHNGISYTGKTISLYWIRALGSISSGLHHGLWGNCMVVVCDVVFMDMGKFTIIKPQQNITKHVLCAHFLRCTLYGLFIWRFSCNGGKIKILKLNNYMSKSKWPHPSKLSGNIW